MTFDWYKIANLVEFQESGLVSKSVNVTLQGVGAKAFLLTKGNMVSLTVDGVMLSLDVMDENPFVFQERALYLDANDDLWYGILIDES